MPAGQDYAVLLRVYALKRDLEPQRVREILQVSEESPPISSVSFNEDESMLTVSFVGGPPLNAEDKKLWQTEEFRNICRRLKERSTAQFEEVAKLGLVADVFVDRYWGKVPGELVREIVRLGLGLWFSY